MASSVTPPWVPSFLGTAGSNDRGSLVHKLGDGLTTDKIIKVGVCIHEHLQERTVELALGITHPAGGSLLNEPNELFFGLETRRSPFL